MIFKAFETTDLVAGRTQPVSTGMWSDGNTIWPNFFTSSYQAQQSSSVYEPRNGLYYLNVYDAPPTQSDADVYFAVTYGHYAGSGSSTFDSNTSNGSLLYPTKAIYNQYRNLLLTPGDAKFTFPVTNSGSAEVTYQDADDIYVVSFRGTKFKDRLDPGQFEISLAGTNTITIIDDSRDNPNTSTETGGKRYNLVLGTIVSGSLVSRNYQGIGSMYPDLGVVIFNPRAIQSLVGSVDGYRTGPTGSYSTTTAPDLSYLDSQWGGGFAQMSTLLFKAIKAAAVVSGQEMKARVTEYVPARHFFIRVKNQDFNYSNNPTFVYNQGEPGITSQDVGKLRFADFSTDPKVYVTTVGLYNESNDLVAVAKLSQPVLKDFTNECLIRVRLDF